MPQHENRSDGGDPALMALTADQREWAERSEALWRGARSLAAERPGVDPSDVYHALRCLQLTSSKRLAAALHRGRLRAHAR